MIEQNRLKAGFYVAGNVGASKVESFDLGVNDYLSMKGQDSVSTSKVIMEGGFLKPKITQTQTQTTTYEAVLKNFVLAIKNKYNFTFSSSTGYRFEKLNLRVESEYRYIKFKSFVSAGTVDTKVDIDIDVVVESILLGKTTTIAEEHQSQHIELPIEIKDMLDPNYKNEFLPNSIPVNVSFGHGTHLQFFNLLYDASIYKNLTLFAGGGFGFGFLSFFDVVYPEDMEVNIYPIKSRFFAYQTKLGASYNVYKNLDLLLTYSNIKGLSKTNIGSFSYSPLTFQTLEFGLRYNF